jgi:hypothetical protein
MPTERSGSPKRLPRSSAARSPNTIRESFRPSSRIFDLPNPVIRSNYGNGFLKQYVRDHLCLRTELATNDVTDYGVKKAVENLPPLRDKLAGICDNYLTVQQDILETFVDRGQLRKLTEPTVLSSGKRIPGLKLENPRQLALMHALVRFAHIAAGSTFTTAELYPFVLAALQISADQYSLASLGTIFPN